MDNVEQLKELSLATRLKRLSDRLSRDISLIYKKLDFDFEARWFVLISLLRKDSPKSVTELAKNLGITHTAINQLSSELEAKNYIFSKKSTSDERIRLLSISGKGKRVYDSMQAAIDKIRIANNKLIGNSKINILNILGEIEKKLDEKSMFERVWELIDGGPPGKIEICEYRPKFKKSFSKLNYEWLEEFFKVEEYDRIILDHPREKIIKTGGTILFALLNGEAVGTCAVIKHPGRIFEIAKMGVTKKMRGFGIGRKLLEASINKAKAQGAGRIILFTNKNLTRANNLYKSFGFKKIKNVPINNPGYLRSTFAMQLIVN